MLRRSLATCFTLALAALAWLSPSVCAQTSGIGSGVPLALPIAIGACLFEAPDRCSDLAPIAVPDGVTSFWTSLAPAHGPLDAIVQILPTPCCSRGTCGDFSSPAVRVGDRISVFAQIAPKVVRIVDDCVRSEGIDGFVVPVVPCGTPHGSAPVVGFALVAVGAVDTAGASRGMTLRVVCPFNPASIGSGRW